ncbi:hypothetical protein scyTo_0024390 [Scyliorhinus torazame]|uniref:Claudin n=1 Tax=Scyliorhinus torazame TaxID=75743 RepID=A0A401QDS9_SCYTO|nr:hypothetical protein [Scyliorhinus torazame]
MVGGNGTQPLWEGLWMCCAVHAPEARHCAPYDSLLDLPQDLLAARALTLIAAILGLLAVGAGLAGALCVKDPLRRGSLTVSAGILFLVCGVLMLLTAGWSTHAIRQDFYDPLVALDGKREPGAAVFVAFAAGAAQFLGGLLLCFAWTRKSEVYPADLQKASSTVQKPAHRKM